MKKLIVRLAKDYASWHAKRKGSDTSFVFGSVLFPSLAGLFFFIYCVPGHTSTANLLLSAYFLLLGFMTFERLGYRTLLRERESAQDTPPPK